jgi:hypothetical protein
MLGGEGLGGVCQLWAGYVQRRRLRHEHHAAIVFDTPGGNRGEWKFATVNAGEKVTILHDAEHPSSIALSVVHGLNVPAGVAACGSLRGQPCRQK